jgi:hypothetical protein
VTPTATIVVVRRAFTSVALPSVLTDAPSAELQPTHCALCDDWQPAVVIGVYLPDDLSLSVRSFVYGLCDRHVREAANARLQIEQLVKAAFGATPRGRAS